MEKKKTKFVVQNELVTAVALIVIGALFCAFRSSMLEILLTIVGVVLIVLGVYNLVRKNFAEGVIETVIGIVIIVCGWTLLEITLLILGIIFVAYAAYILLSTFKKIKTAKGFDKIMLVVNPLLLLAFGIMLIVSYWVLDDAICIVIGVVALLDGIMMIFKKN
ncbi:MAG: DUF308 domain-containing protein [Clostridia bacterium]